MHEPGHGRGGRGVGLALAGLAILLTVIEFLLGMWASLYDRVLPNSVRSVFDTPYITNDRALAAHVAVGVLLGLVGIALVVWAAVRRRPRVVMMGVGGLIGVALGAYGGSVFLATGDPLDSFGMAVGFLLALGAYYRVIQLLRRPPWFPPGPWSPGSPTPSPPMGAPPPG
jgi:hypothetical protein